MIKKFYCINDHNYIYYGYSKVLSYNYIKGKIYNFEFSYKDTYPYVDKDNDCSFTFLEMGIYFITLDEWREKRINKILNN